MTDDMDRFVRDLVESLLNLTDEDTGESCPLSPFEIEQVGLRLTKAGRSMTRSLLRDLTDGDDKNESSG